MMTVAEREELFNSVDLRSLTGQPVPQRADASVRVDCPVHGGKNDLAVFPDHAYCFSAACGWSGRAFDTAAVLLGLYSRKDPLWPNKHFQTIIKKLQELKAGYIAPTVKKVEPPTEAQLNEILRRSQAEDSDLVKIDRWRGWPLGTSKEYELGLTNTAIVIPVRRSDGKLLTIRYRIRPKLESPERPKYWGTTGANDENILFGGYTIPTSKGKAIVLVEGEFDTISSQLAGIPTLNFINGAGWKAGREVVFNKLLKKYQNVLVAYDQDQAGRTAIFGGIRPNGKEIEGIYTGRVQSFNDRVLPVVWEPDLGKDPNEFIKKQGVRAWRDLLTKRMSTASLPSNPVKQTRQTEQRQTSPSFTGTALSAW